MSEISKKMLINATLASGQIRVALIIESNKGPWLYDLDLEKHGKEQQQSNIYKGVITRIEPSLEAAFINYGTSERHGFLPFREISHEYLQPLPPSADGERPSIREQIHEGLELIVQVGKEARDKKGAALTTFISLAGCYLVLMPNNPRAGGISRRIEGEERFELKEALSALQIPDGMGVIVRTAGVGRSAEELQWDLNVLLNQWKAIKEAASERKAPFLIHQESNVMFRAFRDHLKDDIGEIVIDNPELYETARKHLEIVRPDFIPRLRLYSEQTPLFSHYKVEYQIESAFKRKVDLPSGGSLVIDGTEALVSIDVNSAKATRGSDIEETALHTNLEAAEEIARQLRLRDIGGLIVIDFIDMMVARNQRTVEQRLRESLEIDRAKVQVGRISRFGLLEMSRQRLRPALMDSAQVNCPRCSGTGKIRSVDTICATILRVIEEESNKEDIAQINIELPLDTATYLINEKRKTIMNIEQTQHIHVVIIPNHNLETPDYRIRSYTKNDIHSMRQSHIHPYAITKPPEAAPKILEADSHHTSEAAVQTSTPLIPAPKVEKKSKAATKSHANKPSLIKKIWATLVGDDEEEEPKEENTVENKPNNAAARSDQNYNRRRRNNNNPNRTYNKRGGGRYNNSTNGNYNPNRRRAPGSENYNTGTATNKPSGQRRRSNNNRGGYKKPTTHQAPNPGFETENSSSSSSSSAV